MRDQCHFTAEFRGATHAECNLHYQISKNKYQLPVFFHNLKGYDSHLIFQDVKTKHGRINVIANNSEKYISFSIGKLKFLDSMQFLSGSLDTLANQLNPDQFNHFKSSYPDEKYYLLMKKGVYPYSYMDNMEKFSETQLPQKEAFFNDLENKPISSKHYKHAKNVWKQLGCTTMQDYHNHYLKGDVLLLADIFETFRCMATKTYKLDPAQYYSLLGFSWDAMLKYT